MILLEPQEIADFFKTKKAKYFDLILDVPENMNYLATDSDGSVYAYENVARLDGDDWSQITGDWMFIADVDLKGALWSDTCKEITFFADLLSNQKEPNNEASKILEENLWDCV